ncbi:MAG: glycosyltransferase family 4 protein, partial [Acidimicrobiia bacterium]
ARAPIAVGCRAWSRTRAAVAGADVVHVHEPFVPAVGLAALTAGCPVVATFHADPSPWVRTVYRVGARLGRRLLGNAVSVAVSSVAASALRPIVEPVVVPNAIDVTAYAHTLERDRHRAVFVGRDDPRKGLDVVLEAWPLVRRRIPAAVLTVVGTMRQHAPPGVHYLGEVPEDRKRAELGTAAILCAPNTSGESFGLVLAEGMAAGCVVVATALPAFAAVLGGTGVLVSRWDVEGFAEAVADLMGDDGRRRRLAAAATVQVERFERAAVVQRYLGLYAEARRRAKTG